MPIQSWSARVQAKELRLKKEINQYVIVQSRERLVTFVAQCRLRHMLTSYRDCLVLDNFLDAALHQSLLDHALSQATATEAAEVTKGVQLVVDRQLRSAELCRLGLAALHEPFFARVMSQFDIVTGELGIKKFAIEATQVELVAHNDGARFRRHIDTLTQENFAARQFVRILSFVYYFHRTPKHFSGGELELFPVGNAKPFIIEPCDNRLVAFPSYIPHEVHEVSCPSREYSDSRFAINIWLSRARGHQDSVRFIR